MLTDAKTPVLELARLQLAELQVPWAPLPVFAEELAICRRYGHLKEFPGGFVAWFRCTLQDFVRGRQAVLESKHPFDGPVIFFTAFLSTLPGVALPVARSLLRSEAPEFAASIRKDGYLRLRKVRQCTIS